MAKCSCFLCFCGTVCGSFCSFGFLLLVAGIAHGFSVTTFDLWIDHITSASVEGDCRVQLSGSDGFCSVGNCNDHWRTSASYKGSTCTKNVDRSSVRCPCAFGTTFQAAVGVDVLFDDHLQAQVLSASVKDCAVGRFVADWSASKDFGMDELDFYVARWSHPCFFYRGATLSSTMILESSVFVGKTRNAYSSELENAKDAVVSARNSLCGIGIMIQLVAFGSIAYVYKSCCARSRIVQPPLVLSGQPLPAAIGNPTKNTTKITDQSLLDDLQQLLDATFADRAYKGGYIPLQLKLVEAWTVNNTEALADYKKHRIALSAKQSICSALDEMPLSHVFVSKEGNGAVNRICNDLEPSVNEFLFFHGTSAEAAKSIASTDFRLPNSHTHGGLYGKGIYLAESCSKAHMYCKEINRENVCPILLTRGTLGKVHNVTDEKPDAHGLEVGANVGSWDSVCGDRRSLKFNFSGYREFIVYDPNQAVAHMLL